MDLNLSNVITVSISQAGQGISAYNTSNLALFTRETASASFGTDGFKIYLSPTEVGNDFGTGSETFKMANAIFSQQPNILANQGSLIIIEFSSNTETLGEAITRTTNLVQYFGVIASEIIDETDGKAAAAIVQPLNKMLGLVSRTEADILASAYFDDIRVATQNKTRCLYHGLATDSEALVMLASFFSRGLSVNFRGTNTTHTMHLKDLTGVQPGNITQTLLTAAQSAGVDVYSSFQGVAKTFISGANEFFDQVYNRAWFSGKLEVDAFNFLAQSSTKIPQTEAGMDNLKSVFRKVCEEAVNNGYFAPGEWNLPETFGNQDDFYENIRQRGYYIYSRPISLQSPSDRESRIAPIVQIAAKESGALHSASVIVNINK